MAISSDGGATPLEKEAQYLYQQLFASLPSEMVVQDYVRAHSEIAALANPPVTQMRTLDVIVERGLDANGIEPFLRSGQSRHLLGKKMLLLAYLAQCSAARETQAPARNPWWVLLEMSACVTAGAYSLARGYYQKWRYGLL